MWLMKRRVAQRRMVTIGEAILLAYLIAVMGIAVMRILTGFPTINELASSPALVARGEWWRLITSAFIVDGPVIPQMVALAALGSLGIYMGGSWVFWVTALSAHILGTLIAYVAFAALWLVNRTADAAFLNNPDYGVSLVWCAALGVFAAICWFGGKKASRLPQRPLLVAATVLAIGIVTFYSDDMAAMQHMAAYIIGFAIMALVDRDQVSHHDLKLRRALVQGSDR